MNIYVGQLPFDVNENDLEVLFSEFGEVASARLIMDRYSGRPKGFAFVEMADRSGGQQAMEHLNKQIFKSRSLVCNEAKPQKKGKRRR